MTPPHAAVNGATVGVEPVGRGDPPQDDLIDRARGIVQGAPTIHSVENGRAVLSIDIRQYAAKQEVETGRGGQKLGLDRFDSQGKGKVEWSAAALLPLHGELNEKMQLAGHIGTGQQGMAATELQARLAKADDKKK